MSPVPSEPVEIEGNNLEKASKKKERRFESVRKGITPVNDNKRPLCRSNERPVYLAVTCGVSRRVAAHLQGRCSLIQSPLPFLHQ